MDMDGDSVEGESLDDAEAEEGDDDEFLAQQQQDEIELEEVAVFLKKSPADALTRLLQLSPFEHVRWMMGHRLTSRQMAIRIFSFLDNNGDKTISMKALDLLIKSLQGQLNFTKETFDFVEVRSSCYFVASCNLSRLSSTYVQSLSLPSFWRG